MSRLLQVIGKWNICPLFCFVGLTVTDRSCMFPFSYEGHEYASCTFYDWGAAWCKHTPQDDIGAECAEVGCAEGESPRDTVTAVHQAAGWKGRFTSQLQSSPVPMPEFLATKILTINTPVDTSSYLQNAQQRHLNGHPWWGIFVGFKGVLSSKFIILWA